MSETAQASVTAAEIDEAVAALDVGPCELASEWDFYIDQPLVKPGDQQLHKPCGTKLLGSFSTVQDFWRFYHTLSDVQSLPKNANVQMFRHGVRPAWEDEANVNGGRWLLLVPRQRACEAWTLLLVAVLTERFEWSDDICGVVLSVRPNQTTLRLWNTSLLAVQESDARGRAVRDLVGADEFIYQRHEDLARLAPSKKKRRRRRRGGASAAGGAPGGAEAEDGADAQGDAQAEGAAGDQDDDDANSDGGDSAQGTSPAPTPSPAATPRIQRLDGQSAAAVPAPASNASVAQESDPNAVKVCAEHDPQLVVFCFKGDSADVVRRMWGVFPNGVLRNGRKQAVETISGDDGPYTFTFPVFGPLTPATLLACALQSHAGTAQAGAGQQSSSRERTPLQSASVPSQYPSPMSVNQPPPAYPPPTPAAFDRAAMLVGARRASSLINPPSEGSLAGSPTALRRSNSYDDVKVQSTKAVQRILNKIAAEKPNSWKESGAATKLLGALVLGQRHRGSESEQSPGSIRRQQQAAVSMLDRCWVPTPTSGNATALSAFLSPRAPSSMSPPLVSPPPAAAPRDRQWLEALDLSSESSLFSNIFPGDFLGGARASASASNLAPAASAAGMNSREGSMSPAPIDADQRSRSRRVETTKHAGDWSKVVALCLLAVLFPVLLLGSRVRLRAPALAPLHDAPAIAVIRARRSWRSYSDREPSDEQLERLRLFAGRSEVRTGPFTGSRVDVAFVRCSQLSGRRKLGTYGFISGARSVEDFGVVFERVVLEATRMGLCTCWLGGTFSEAAFRRAAEEAGVVFGPGDKVFVACPLGFPTDDNSLLRSVMVGRMLDKESGRTSRLPYDRLFFDLKSGSPLDVAALGSAALREAAEAVRVAPSACNMQPWRVVRESEAVWHFYALRVSVTVPEALASNDCGIAACHWEQVMASHNANGAWSVLKESPPAPAPGCIYKFTWTAAQ
eukprot:m51a1_g731 hypothetical protein (963) ;mRNA; f:476050-480116